MIKIEHLSKQFTSGTLTVEALKDINLTIEDGDIFGIIGMSGAGKSTLVRCINMLERPTEGTINVDGKDMGSLSDSELRAARHDITMIFQAFNLLKQRNCLKNICFPMELTGVPKQQAEKRAKELLEIVGLPDKAKAYPAQLSGGQQQRIAIARALATDPKVLLCDEATSALDPNTTHQILSLLKEINEKMGITIVVITHQMSVVQEVCNKVAILDDGMIVEEGLVKEVFASPKSDAAKRLVFPGMVDAEISDPSNEKKIRIVYKDAEIISRPLIASMAAEQGIFASVLAADTRKVSGDNYGTSLISVPVSQYEKALTYLGAVPGIVVKGVEE